MIYVFIVNSILVRQGLADELRSKLALLSDIESYVFATHSCGHEKQLTQIVLRTFDSERVRIYGVGGIGTIHNIINNIKDFANVEVGWIPTHRSNFLDVIVEDSSDFYDFDRMLRGNARPIDVVKVNNIYALNAFSLGIDTDLIEVAENTKELGFLNSKIPSILGLFHSLIFSQNYQYKVQVDGKTINERFIEIFFGNGRVLGHRLYFGRDAIVTDGLANYRMIGGFPP